ncbi:MAG: hypothetical protein QXJ06_00005, partial [Candidatus Aenigmatarchaeota archaeon]
AAYLNVACAKPTTPPKENYSTPTAAVVYESPTPYPTLTATPTPYPTPTLTPTPYPTFTPTTPSKYTPKLAPSDQSEAKDYCNSVITNTTNIIYNPNAALMGEPFNQPLPNSIVDPIGCQNQSGYVYSPDFSKQEIEEIFNKINESSLKEISTGLANLCGQNNIIGPYHFSTTKTICEGYECKNRFDEIPVVLNTSAPATVTNVFCIKSGGFIPGEGCNFVAAFIDPSGRPLSIIFGHLSELREDLQQYATNYVRYEKELNGPKVLTDSEYEELINAKTVYFDNYNGDEIIVSPEGNPIEWNGHNILLVQHIVTRKKMPKITLEPGEEIGKGPSENSFDNPSVDMRLGLLPEGKIPDDMIGVYSVGEILSLFNGCKGPCYRRSVFTVNTRVLPKGTIFYSINLRGGYYGEENGKWEISEYPPGYYLTANETLHLCN